jgi:hypothetical protein
MKPRTELIAAALAAAAIFGAAPAYADPDPPPPPPAPAAPAGVPGIPNLTREQQCAWIAYRTWVPCNWMMPNPPPPGTPGTLYGPPQ